jgi:hypothetical protein
MSQQLHVIRASECDPLADGRDRFVRPGQADKSGGRQARQQLLNPVGAKADFVTFPGMVAQFSTASGYDWPDPVGRFIRLNDESDRGFSLARQLSGAFDKPDQAVAVPGTLCIISRSGAIDDTGEENKKGKCQRYYIILWIGVSCGLCQSRIAIE